ncbi:MAG: RidA family protein, partial [Chloroflexota bacterium]|nr:RidA family protein [Chloroflexota bacterium]
MNAEERLRELGIDLPAAAQPLGAYTPTVRAGSLVFVSGTLPISGGQLAVRGKLGSELSIEEGQAAARRATINALGSLKAEIGSLDKVTRIVRLEGHVASANGFTDQPKVLNGASELLVEIFGDRGR